MPRFAAQTAFILLLLLSHAAALVPVPELTGRVVDQTGLLSESQRSALNEKLRAFEERKGSQVAVLIVPSAAPEALEQFSMRVVEKWKLGRKKEDDGALLLIAMEDRAVRIEVGYGLEGALSDIVCKRIIEDIITPHFRSGDFPGGVQAGVDAMLKVIDGEPLPPPALGKSGRSGQRGVGAGAMLFFIAVLVVGAVFRTIFGRLLGATFTSALAFGLGMLLLGSLVFTVLAAFAAFLYVMMGHQGMMAMGGRGRGGFGGGFGGGGFGGGGGFSGGGGGFGGGGASGRW